MSEMKVIVKRKNEPVHFTVEDSMGHSIEVEGGPAAGGQDRAFRPMALVLGSIACCSVMDAIVILKKQQQEVDDIQIEVRGQRPEGKYPSPFEHIHLHYIITGKVDDDRATKAIKLAVEKYCSVAEMFRGNVSIDYSHEIIS